MFSFICTRNPHFHLFLNADCCQGRCQDGYGTENPDSAQAGPSAEDTGTPGNGDKDEKVPGAAVNGETSEMVRATFQKYFCKVTICAINAEILCLTINIVLLILNQGS